MVKLSMVPHAVSPPPPPPPPPPLTPFLAMAAPGANASRATSANTSATGLKLDLMGISLSCAARVGARQEPDPWGAPVRVATGPWSYDLAEPRSLGGVFDHVGVAVGDLAVSERFY